MWNARLDESQAGIKFARRNINNLRHTDDTTLRAESDNKSYIWQTHSKHYPQWWKIESISSKARNKTRVPTFTISIQYSFGSFGHSNQSRKRNKRNPNWKRRNKTLTVCTQLCSLSSLLPPSCSRACLPLFTALPSVNCVSQSGRKAVPGGVFSGVSSSELGHVQYNRSCWLSILNIAKLQDIKLTHRNPLHSYTLTMRKQKEKFKENKETIPFTIVMKE